MTRTQLQNKSLHLWLRQLAEVLTEIGFDMRSVKVEIKPTEENLKECFFKPVMSALYPEIGSTTEMSTAQVVECVDVLNKALGEKLGVHVPWPCIETQYKKAIDG